MADWEWRFKAALNRVVDGDTVNLRVDLGFHTYHDISLRLADIDAAELFRGERREEGRAALAEAARWFNQHPVGASGHEISIVTEKDKQTFNRYIGRVLCACGSDLAMDLIARRPDLFTVTV